MKRIACVAWLIAAACLLSACGFRFGPGRSMYDEALFSEMPYIVSPFEGYSLRWRYGTWNFYFRPDSKIVDGQLLFALGATSSSGDLTGKYGEIPITDPKRIRALEAGGAYWLEPDGRRVRLEIRRLEDDRPQPATGNDAAEQRG